MDLRQEMSAARAIPDSMLTQVGRLDYPDLEIDMVVESAVERELRLNACAKEPELVAWIESFDPGSTFWDVGANVGPYSLLAAALGHKVVAVEPAIANARRLTQNACLNGLSAVVLPIALSSSDGLTGLNLTSLEPGATHGSRYQEAEPFPTLTLTAETLVYRLKVPPPDHVKIDVDGEEVRVLAGFERIRPVSFMIECDNETRPPIHNMLQAWGYRFVEAWERSEPGVANVLYRRK